MYGNILAIRCFSYNSGRFHCVIPFWRQMDSEIDPKVVVYHAFFAMPRSLSKPNMRPMAMSDPSVTRSQRYWRYSTFFFDDRYWRYCTLIFDVVSPTCENSWYQPTQPILVNLVLFMCSYTGLVVGWLISQKRDAVCYNMRVLVRSSSMCAAFGTKPPQIECCGFQDRNNSLLPVRTVVLSSGSIETSTAVRVQ